MARNSAAIWILTAALVLVFAYFGVEKFLHPLNWIGFMPAWIDGLMGLSRDVWLQIFGVIEIVLAILLLIPVRRIRQAGAILMALHLMGVLTQVGWNDIGVRDLGLLLSSVALFLLL